MDLDPKHLDNLLTIAECGSFSRAAALRRISQPALSASIAHMERRLGARILERGRFGANLNDLGRLLVRHARAVRAELAGAVEEVRLKKLGVDGPLLVGATPVAVSLVAAALAQLKKETPHVSASIIEANAHEEHIAGLQLGQLDFAVGPVGIYAKSAGIVEEPLKLDPLCVVVAPNHPIAKKKSVSLRSLADLDWALPSEQSAFRHQLEGLFVTAGLPWPTVAIATNSMIALKSVIMHTGCVTIMPQQAVALEAAVGRLRAIQLRDAGSPRRIGFQWRRDRELSPLALRFADALRAVAKKA